MDTNWTRVCILLLLCTGLLYLANAQTSTATLDPKPAVKGDNSQHTIRCGFALSTGNSLQSMKMYLGSGLAQNNIAYIFPIGLFGWYGNADVNTRQRGYLLGSTDGHLSLVFNDTKCSDKDKVYTCSLDYSDNQNNLQVASSTVTVQVDAAPLAPNEMIRKPNSDNVTEFDNMEFECSGNVGSPAGSFRWFKFVGSGASQDITAQAVQGNPISAGDCTFNRTSRLTLNMTRTEANKRLVVRCRVDQKLVTADLSACSNPSTDFCRTSPQIDIQYPVKVSVTSDTVTGVEGAQVRIVCSTDGNPQPYLVEWRKEGENDTRTGNTLLLSDPTLNDTGSYICTAHNTIAGVARSAAITVSLTVAKTPTQPPTPTTLSTSSEMTTKKGGSPQTAGPGDDEMTIIIVVVVVVLVVVFVAIVVVIVFLRRRRKAKGVEEPPEKPFNSHAGINAVDTRPDLVSNDYNNPPPPFKSEDGLAYAELQFDNKPRSRRPLAIDDSHTDYSDVSMPQV